MARKFVLKARMAADFADLAADLNPEQAAVATAGLGPMFVVAGAGSGKTRALTYRVAYLLRAGVDPSAILLMTFTNRAARDMVSRVELLVREKTPKLWAGTFHHIANRILRRYAGKLGLSNDYTILDREDASDLIKSCVAEAGIAVEKRRFPRKRVLMEISSFLQNTLRPLDDVLAARYPTFAAQREEIQRVMELYAQRKRQRQFLDYDDLLSAWLLLLRDHPEAREALAAQFQHVLVDEYQDTNAIQGAIVDILASHHGNVCVVGDDSQSIYSFRGADFRNILRFRERYPDAREFRLETNYRSVPEILNLANASIACNVERLPKELRAVRPSGLKPAVVLCRDSLVQAQFVAEYILHLHDEGRRLLDLAVLYRSHWNSLDIQLELRRRNIPYQVRGGLRFFEQAHIKDVLACLRLIQNPYDEIAWRRALQMLPRVGGALSSRLWTAIAASDRPLEAAALPETHAVLPSSARPFYRNFAELLTELRTMKSPAEMIDLIMRRWYRDYLQTHYENARLREEDLKGMAAFAEQYNTLEAFLADVSLAGEFSGETVVTGPEEWDYVILSTVHQSKGLEWPVVFIPWLADGRFPTDMCINTPEELEEERRVFHVAVTRAKDELYLVVPRMQRGQGRRFLMMKPSRFLTELPNDLVEPLELEEGLPHTMVGPKPFPELPAAKGLPAPDHNDQSQEEEE
jgi:DNA helicase-2/ATP-dependent DNA helicase PcrA